MANDGKNKQALVRNAADPDQVAKANEKIETRRERELNDLRVVLGTPEGQRLIWRFLSHCKTFESIWSPNAQIHYNSGMQDVGHFLMSEIVEAEPEALLRMMKASKDNQ